MTDPPEVPPVGRLGATSVDCPDPAALADFYGTLLGMDRLVETPDGGVVAAGHPFCQTTVAG